MNLPTEVFDKPSPETWDFLSREDEGFSFRERKNDDIFVLKMSHLISSAILGYRMMFDRVY